MLRAALIRKRLNSYGRNTRFRYGPRKAPLNLRQPWHICLSTFFFSLCICSSCGCTTSGCPVWNGIDRLSRRSPYSRRSTTSTLGCAIHHRRLVSLYSYYFGSGCRISLASLRSSERLLHGEHFTTLARVRTMAATKRSARITFPQARFRPDVSTGLEGSGCYTALVCPAEGSEYLHRP